MATPATTPSSSSIGAVSNISASYQADYRTVYLSKEARGSIEENLEEMNKKQKDAKSLLSHRVFDRQIRLWGVEAQRRLLRAHVLIVGMTTINVELAKSLALSGVQVSLCDDHPLDSVDFSFNFLVHSEAQRQQAASVASSSGLQSMSPLIDFQVLPESSF
ncbi:ubiquitin activating enzyme, partial [Cystoisospora suis]